MFRLKHPREGGNFHDAFTGSTYVQAAFIKAGILMSYTVMVHYVPGTVQSTSQSFSYVSLFQPGVNVCKSVTMETTIQENLSSTLSPPPHPVIPNIFNLQNYDTKNQSWSGSFNEHFLRSCVFSLQSTLTSRWWLQLWKTYFPCVPYKIAVVGIVIPSSQMGKLRHVKSFLSGSEINAKCCRSSPTCVERSASQFCRAMLKWRMELLHVELPP